VPAFGGLVAPALWLDWHKVIAPDNKVEIKALEADRGSYLGYLRLVGRRQGSVRLAAHIESLPMQYTKKTLLRSGDPPIDDCSVMPKE
jgi:hypothetical protein